MPRRGRRASPHPTRPPKDWRRAAALKGFHSSVGFTIDPQHSGRGRCTVTGVVRKSHLNINGVVHGGVYATILDTAMGASVVSVLGESEVTATTSLYVEYLRPARQGDRLTARGKVLRRGRHLAFVEGDLYGADGIPLSQAHGTWYIWSDEDGRWGIRPKGALSRVARRA